MVLGAWSEKDEYGIERVESLWEDELGFREVCYGMDTLSKA